MITRDCHSHNFVLRILKDYEAVSRLSAEVIAEAIEAKADALVCAATGSTPTRAYELLCQRAVDGLPVDRLRLLKLDEWGGFAMEDEATCEAYLQRHLVRPLKIDAQRYLAFQSNPEDPSSECEKMRARLAELGPIDICILGLGLNGHLGFNEPAEFLQPFAHVARLADATRRHPMVSHSPEKVSYGLTSGISDIMQSRFVVLMVSGESKAEPMRQLMSQEITPQFPASMLWMHPNVLCVCDESAASLL